MNGDTPLFHYTSSGLTEGCFNITGFYLFPPPVPKTPTPPGPHHYPVFTPTLGRTPLDD